VLVVPAEEAVRYFGIAALTKAMQRAQLLYRNENDLKAVNDRRSKSSQRFQQLRDEARGPRCAGRIKKHRDKEAAARQKAERENPTAAGPATASGQGRAMTPTRAQREQAQQQQQQQALPAVAGADADISSLITRTGSPVRSPSRQRGRIAATPARANRYPNLMIPEENRRGSGGVVSPARGQRRPMRSGSLPTIVREGNERARV